MKTGLIFMGMLALTVTASRAATGFENQGFSQGFEWGNPNDTILSDTGFWKSVEEVIAEDKLITEFREESELPLTFMVTARIAEDNQIIENTIPNEYYPLDFEKSNPSKSNNQKTKIPIILKL